MRVLGVNAIFHDPSAALVVDGRIVAAAEEERFSRRKHGKRPLAFSSWELPEMAARWCLDEGGVAAGDVDVITYSYEPSLAPEGRSDGGDTWERLRTLYARRAPLFLAAAVPGLRADRVCFLAHHEAHAASAYLASGWPSCATLVVDGR